MSIGTKIRIVSGVAAMMAIGPVAEARVWYVDAGVLQSGDGASWPRAFRHLQEALTSDELAVGDRIWVAAGTYAPDRYGLNPEGTNDSSASFKLAPGVELYGGFAASGGPRSSLRDPRLFPSILSGDICDLEECVAAARHIVTAEGVGARVRIDGFVITGGAAGVTPDGYGGSGLLVSYDGDVIVANCEFVDNSAEIGGALYFDRADATVVNCRFFANQAAAGGAVYIGGPTSVANFVNCTFISNTAADGAGGAVYLTAPAQARLFNCTLLDNFGIQHGRALYNVPEVTNSIVWGSGLNSISGAQSVTTSCVQFGHEGFGNISEFPLFADPLNGDYRLAPGSPCVDAGAAEEIPKDVADLDGDRDIAEATPLDLDLGRRVIDRAIDMGAFELCPYDINGDGTVGVEDFLIVLGAWGTDPDGPPDFDGNGDVGIADLLTFLGRWGACGR